MRTLWTIILAALMFLSYGGSATAGNLIAGCGPEHCEGHAEQAGLKTSLQTCQATDCEDSQSHDHPAGHCHCPCHLAPLADIAFMTMQVIPGLRPLSLSKIPNETVQEGPTLGIDLPPQLS